MVPVRPAVIHRGTGHHVLEYLDQIGFSIKQDEGGKITAGNFQ
jgi:hypothetical protein